jgi:serine/threonine protein kinase
MTRDPETKEFMMVMENPENLKNILSSNFENILWKDKIKCLYDLICNLQNKHGLGYCFKNTIHNGNILYNDGNNKFYISDFKLFRTKNEDNKMIYDGVLPYIAPEVLSGESYTLSSDIYSFGIIMIELSSENPPFHNRKHDLNLVSDICDGLRPEFGRNTPDIYMKLAHECMNSNSNKRPTANELWHILHDWNYNLNGGDLGYNKKQIKIKIKFNQADNLSSDTYYRKCFYCNKPYINEELWCKKCDPYCILEGWSSGNHDIDGFIKDTIFNAVKYYPFLEWIPFNKLMDIQQIGKGGFSEVYSAIWDKPSYIKQHHKNQESGPTRVALKKLNRSQGMSADYLNKVYVNILLLLLSYCLERHEGLFIYFSIFIKIID